MDPVAVQAGIKAVIDILKNAKERKDVTLLDDAIARLLDLQERVAGKKTSGFFANPGEGTIFHKNE
jgi:hypothetical protein